MLIAENIHKRFGDLEVLKGVSLRVEQGEIISIVGRSGAGKTTLLQILGTLERPDSGTLTIHNQEPFNLSSNSLAKFRNKHLGFVFQFHQLLPEFTALENVCLPGFIGGEVSKAEVEHRATKWLNYLGLADRAAHKPSQLSGGEQQRVAVARALINNPQTIFADEPSGNLDSKNARDLHDLFAQLRADFNQTFVIVTHNAELAAMADRTLTMEDGKLVGQ
jgi:lipoprotein-releasing system ATP-binding protein